MQASVQQIAEFFLYLQKELKLAVCGNTGYRSAINHIFTLADTDVAPNRIISKMFSSFDKLFPPREINHQNETHLWFQTALLSYRVKC